MENSAQYKMFTVLVEVIPIKTIVSIVQSFHISMDIVQYSTNFWGRFAPGNIKIELCGEICKIRQYTRLGKNICCPFIVVG